LNINSSAALENRQEADKAEKQQLAKAEIETAKVSAAISSANVLIENGRLEDAKKQLDPFKGTSDERVTASYSRIARIENDFRTIVRDSGTWTEVQNARKNVQDSSSRDASNKLYRQLLDELSQKEKTIQDQFALTLRQADSALAAGKHAEARSLANRADQMDLDDRKVSELVKRIELGENAQAFEKAINARNVKEAERLYSIVARLSPKDSRLSEYREQIKNILPPGETSTKTVTVIDSLEHEGIIAFYSGDYRNAIEQLKRVTNVKKDSARAYFYLGCSTAAIALMKPKNEEAKMLERVREYFVQVHKIDPGFKHSRKFISPRIMQIYDANK